MSEQSRRFLVVDLGDQLRGEHRFAVWDREVERFWKINNHQTWRGVTELVGDFRALYSPEPRLAQAMRVMKAQEDDLIVQAILAGFDVDD